MRTVVFVLSLVVLSFLIAVPAKALTITSPADGSFYPKPKTIYFSAETANPDVTTVEFYDNGTLLYKDTAASFTTPVWLSIRRNGDRVLLAKGLNSSGQVVESAQVQIKIDVETVPPAVPTGFKIEFPSCTQIKFSWNPTTDNVAVSSYWLTRDGRYWNETRSNIYTLTTNLVEGSTHYYAVSATDEAGNRSAESGMTVTGPACPPKLPVITVPAPNYKITKAMNITVQANPPADFVPTKIEYYSDAMLIGTATAAPYSISRYFDVKTNGTHQLTAKSYSSTGETRVSAAVPLVVEIETIPPSVPGSPILESPSCTEAKLSWGQSTDSGGGIVHGYVVLKNGKYLKQVGRSVLSISETGLDDRLNYAYSVYAFDSNGNISAPTSVLTKVACNPIPSPSASPSPSPSPTPAVPVASTDRCHNDLLARLEQGAISGEPAALEIPIQLNRQRDVGSVISFGVPFAAGAVKDPRRISVVTSVGVPVQGLRVKTLLCDFNSAGEIKGAKSVLLQFPTLSIAPDVADLVIKVNSVPPSPPATTGSVVPYSSLSFNSDSTVDTVERWIEKVGTSYRWTESDPKTSVLFTGKMPATLVRFPEGYLARTGLLGKVMPRKDLYASTRFQALRFLSDFVTPYAKDGMYAGDFKYNPRDPQITEFATDYEGWLYDRCATYLLSYAHTENEDFYKYALKTCSFYSASVTSAGVTTLKPAADVKYSHVRGLYAYYALTGDEDAFRAADAIARMWWSEPLFVAPYRKGHIRKIDGLWTERLLATSMEGLLYGYYLTEIPEYSVAFNEILGTAYRHISTNNQAELDAITGQTGVTFPPQNCFIHNAAQAAEGNTDQPFCSGWMNELMLDVLLKHQEQTNDPRVDEIFVRLARFLRDVGTASFAMGNPLKDSFLEPQVCYDPGLPWEKRRRVFSLYSAGLFSDGTRRTGGEWDDFQHCPDATALTAAAIRGLKRQGAFDLPGPAPFISEGESFMALHQEILYCSEFALTFSSRPLRSPLTTTQQVFGQGYSGGDPIAQQVWVDANKIGYPVYQSAPRRKLSWWFNMSLLQFNLLDEAGVQFDGPAPVPGQIQPASCN